MSLFPDDGLWEGPRNVGLKIGTDVAGQPIRFSLFVYRFRKVVELFSSHLVLNVSHFLVEFNLHHISVVYSSPLSREMR